MAEPGAFGEVASDSDCDEKSNNNHALSVYLRKHDLYDHLYDALVNVDGMDLDTLQNDLRLDEVDEYAKEWKLNLKAKIKFRKLMRIIAQEKAGSSGMDEYRAKMKRTEFLRRSAFEPDDTMTVFLVGDSDSGKTCLMRTYCGQAFNETFTSTIGTDQMVNIQPLADDTNMKITIWDTAGQERFQSICTKQYGKADCMVICYDISKENLFKRFAIWRNQIEEFAPDHVVIVIAGCKTDLANEKLIEKNQKMVNRMVKKEEWKKFSPIVCECSAKKGINIDSVFSTCAQLVLQARKDQGKLEEIRILKAKVVSLEEQQKKSGKCC